MDEKSHSKKLQFIHVNKTFRDVDEPWPGTNRSPDGPSTLWVKADGLNCLNEGGRLAQFVPLVEKQYYI